MRFSSTLLASTALCALPFIAGVNSVAVDSRSLQQPSALSLAQRATPIDSRVDFLTVSAGELAQMLQNGSTTSVELVNAYLERIQRDNHAGLNLRPVIEVAPYDSLMAIAQGLDDERSRGMIRGPLHGIPILVKDNVATAVELGMNTTAGSFALLGSAVPRDAHIVARLRAAGAIILGKANLSEWANFRGGNTNGWSARGQQTSSAYVVGGFAAGGDPCGSSSGSAVAVSAGFAPFSIGTETDGSIICPGERAALFALKPTVGLASRAGIVPISATQDSPGPMAKTTYDLATLLTVIAGFDVRDPATNGSIGKTSDYTTAIVPNGFRGVRIGVPRQFFYNESRTGLASEVYTTTEAVLNRISTLGASVLLTNLPSTEEFVESGNETIVLNFDFKNDLAIYLSELTNSSSATSSTPWGIKTLADAINFNDANAAVEMPAGQCCQEVFIDAVQSTPLTSQIYIDARAANLRLGATDGLEAVFDRFDLTVVAIPSSVASSIAAIVGWPIATVPIGYFGANTTTPGQPYGLSFIARPFDERSLIRVMGAFEESFPKRRVPVQMARVPRGGSS